jgi:PadR family transcriptional regulator, regulatory protein AphA
MSGYELTAAFDRSLRYVWSASHSQIYPELNRLLSDGLIEQVDEGPRGRRTYATTEAGIREMRHWLLEMEPSRAGRNDAFLRFFFLWMLSKTEAEGLLQIEREFHEADLEEYREVAADDGDLPWGQLPIQLGISYKESMIRWLDWAIKEVRSNHRKKRPRVAQSRAS